MIPKWSQWLLWPLGVNFEAIITLGFSFLFREDMTFTSQGILNQVWIVSTLPHWAPFLKRGCENKTKCYWQSQSKKVVFKSCDASSYFYLAFSQPGIPQKYASVVDFSVYNYDLRYCDESVHGLRSRNQLTNPCFNKTEAEWPKTGYNLTNTPILGIQVKISNCSEILVCSMVG